MRGGGYLGGGVRRRKAGAPLAQCHCMQVPLHTAAELFTAAANYSQLLQLPLLQLMPEGEGLQTGQEAWPLESCQSGLTAARGSRQIG